LASFFSSFLSCCVSLLLLPPSPCRLPKINFFKFLCICKHFVRLMLEFEL
jgi:hypothetical protein